MINRLGFPCRYLLLSHDAGTQVVVVAVADADADADAVAAEAVVVVNEGEVVVNCAGAATGDVEHVADDAAEAVEASSLALQVLVVVEEIYYAVAN